MERFYSIALAAEQLDVLTLVKDSTGAVMAVLIIPVVMICKAVMKAMGTK